MKNYKLLSDAILDGSKMSEKTIGQYVDDRGRTCAIGAAAMAIRSSPLISSMALEIIRSVFESSLLNHEVSGCPAEGCIFENSERGMYVDLFGRDDSNILISTVIHLNDYHDPEWTRERIAGWVATIEAKLGLCEIVSAEAEGSNDYALPSNEKEVASIVLA